MEWPKIPSLGTTMLEEQKRPKWPGRRRIVQQPHDTILKLKGCHVFVEKKLIVPCERRISGFIL